MNTELRLVEDSPEKLPELIDTIWPFVSGLATTIAETSRGRVNAEDVRALVMSGAMQLWLVLNDQGAAVALVVTEIKSYPQSKVCIVQGLAGHDRGQWMHHLEGIEAWAKALGCVRIEVRGRKGMAKILPDYKLTSVYLEKELH